MAEGASDAEAIQKIRRRIAVRSKVEILSKHAVKIANKAEEHERFLFKVTHLLGVLGFGAFCFILVLGPKMFRMWIYYRYKKWHYYLLDFCYYANTFFLAMLLFFPRNEKLSWFALICRVKSFQGPLAWALIVWRCSLVFSSLDKIVSVVIHFLPGIVFSLFDGEPANFSAMRLDGVAARASWPYVEDKSYIWTWLFLVPLVAYALWQLLYFLVVDVLRRQRLLQDPEIMTSYRELSKKAKRANNIWWLLSGMLGDQNRRIMYILIQAVFTVATMALTVPIFLSYRMHVVFQIFKISATIWYGASFLLDATPRQVVSKEKKNKETIEADFRSDAGTCSWSFY
ncbi:putative membrane protein [Ananas comosus]|uniref:Glycerophosphocholine acyltransferase 1 n=1 Tax=Ananas comosus TaxID=4615 RepID=A0A199UYR6_ANACO|nr:putative membrane protein [Ananas comosus]